MTRSKETHIVDCTCSYCVGDHRLHYGLNIPQDWWAWNAWYVVKYWPRRYLRWTFSFLRKRAKGQVTHAEAIQRVIEAATHKRSCAKSKVLTPSFGFAHAAYFDYFGGQCAEKLEIKPGRTAEQSWGLHWSYCGKPAGHVGKHRCSRPAGSDIQNEWDAGDCTCGLDAALLRLSGRREEEDDQEKELGAVSSGKITERD